MFTIFEKKRFSSAVHAGEYLDYLYYAPKKAIEPLPLVIYLHGAGSRGNDLNQMGLAGAVKEIEEGRALPAMVLAPQCHADHWFMLFEVLCEFISVMRCQNGVDEERVYVTWCSMGGFTTWQLACTHPEWFAAVVPVCGGGQEWYAYRLHDMPIWAFHGLLDETVPAEESVKMARAARRGGANVRLTIYPNVYHNAWENAYADDSLWSWLLTQRKGTNE